MGGAWALGTRIGYQTVARPASRGRPCRVRLLPMEMSISVPEELLRRVDAVARRLGVSRSGFFTQAAERWLEALDDDTTATINRVISDLPADHSFTDTAASALVQDDRD